MNPNKAIRPWILACGRQFGINVAVDYLLKDESTRAQGPYCQYRLLSCVPMHPGVRDHSTRSGNDVTTKNVLKHETTVRIDLFDSQDGLTELAAFGVAAVSNDSIREVFKSAGVGFTEVVTIENMSVVDSEREDYHQYMICTFDEDVSIDFEEINYAVDEIAIEFPSFV